MKTITIPYEEYLELEEAKKAIDQMKEHIRCGHGYEVYIDPGTRNEKIILYDCDEIFKALLGKNELDRTTQLNVWR